MAYILGGDILHGGYTPAYAVSPCGLIICRGQAHKEPVPEWLPPFREKLRVGSLIADLIRNLLRKMKTQRYRDTEIIKLILCHSVPLCWKANGVGVGLRIKTIGDRAAKQTCPHMLLRVLVLSSKL